MKKSFFPRVPGPSPLEIFASRVVRFEESDPMNVMWHGRYPSFLEDAREVMGEKFGISYAHFNKNSIALPIKIMHFDYCLPLYYGDQCTIKLILHWSDAARINIEYEILNPNNQIATKAYTVQLMVDFSGNLVLNPPEFYKTFRKKWEEGEFC